MKNQGKGKKRGSQPQSAVPRAKKARQPIPAETVEECSSDRTESLSAAAGTDPFGTASTGRPSGIENGPRRSKRVSRRGAFLPLSEPAESPQMPPLSSSVHPNVGRTVAQPSTLRRSAANTALLPNRRERGNQEIPSAATTNAYVTTVTQQHPGLVENEDEINRLKNEVSELSKNLTRTRDTLMASVEMHIRRIKDLEKTLSQKDALCESLKRPTENCTCSKSSGTARKSRVDGIEDKFQGVAHSVFEILPEEASDIVREVLHANGSVFRDWTGKILQLPEKDMRRGRPLLKIGGEPAVPKCPMGIALKGKIYTKPASMGKILESIVDGTISEVPEAVFDEREKKLCLSKLSSYKPLRSWFSRVLSEEASALKLSLRCTFFEKLGYSIIRRPAKEKHENLRDLEQRKKEQDHAKEKMLRLAEDGIPDFALWRIGSDDYLQYEEIATEIVQQTSDDMFFKNSAAKAAFLRFRSHEHEHRTEGDSHASIISLARADAWIAVSLMMFSEKEGQGGKRNSKFKKLFQTYLPLALEGILKTFRSFVEENHIEEMQRVMRGLPLDENPYNDTRRLATQVFRMPGTQLDYLAVRSAFVSSNCPILGDVKDCYIGRCSPKENTFGPILAKDEGNHEESDAEESEQDVLTVKRVDASDELEVEDESEEEEDDDSEDRN